MEHEIEDNTEHENENGTVLTFIRCAIINLISHIILTVQIDLCPDFWVRCRRARAIAAVVWLRGDQV